MSDDLTDILGEAWATYCGDKVKPGVICIAAIPYVMQQCFVIRPLSIDPSKAEHREYQLEKIDPRNLANAKQSEWKLPFKDLNLDTEEDLTVVKVKRRPVVVLSRAIVDERREDSSRFQDSFWCIPSYTLVDQFMHSPFKQEFIEEVLALRYRACFPLPYNPHLHDRYSMLRFDRMQPITRDHLNVTDRRLTKEWTMYIQEWTRFFIKGTFDEKENGADETVAMALSEARRLFLEELGKRREKG